MKQKLLIVLIVILFPLKNLFAQESYIGEIRIFAGNFAPLDWAFCNGQLLQIAENDALFSLIGTTYGGDGIVTFALPDLRGKAPVNVNSTSLGQHVGAEKVVLTTSNMPRHNHENRIKVSTANATTSAPSSNSSIAIVGNNYGRSFVPILNYNTETPDVVIQSENSNIIGNATPINIVKPYCSINYIISLWGIYPTQN